MKANGYATTKTTRVRKWYLNHRDIVLMFAESMKKDPDEGEWRVTLDVPSGGDWSRTIIEISDDDLLNITHTTTKETTE